MLKEQPQNIDETLRNFTYMPSKKKKLGESGDTTKADISFREEENNESKQRLLSERFKKEVGTRNYFNARLENEKENVNSSLSLDDLADGIEEMKEETKNVEKVKNMILSYTNPPNHLKPESPIFYDEHSMEDEENISPERFDIDSYKVRKKPATSSASKSQEKVTEKSNNSIFEHNKTASLTQNGAKESVSGLEKIISKYFKPMNARKEVQESKTNSLKIEKVNQGKEKAPAKEDEMSIEDEGVEKKPLPSKPKVVIKDSKETNSRTGRTSVIKEKETKLTPRESSQRNLSKSKAVKSVDNSSVKSRGKSEVPSEKPKKTVGGKSIESRSVSTISRPVSVPKITVISKYLDNNGDFDKSATSMCVENQEDSFSISAYKAVARDSRDPVQTRSQKKSTTTKNLEELLSGVFGSNKRSQSKGKPVEKKEAWHITGKNVTKIESAAEKRKPVASKSLFDFGISKTETNRAKSVDKNNTSKTKSRLFY